MTLLAPLAALFTLLGLPILIMYMLKLRRREVQVSSNMLWERLLRDRQANTPWQRLRRNLLLLLQLLILAALVFALLRPALRVPSVVSGSVVVLLDASASMNATDVAPSRFEAARQAARQIIDGLDGGSRLSIFLVARQPQVLASGEQDKNALYKALQAASPTQGAADWQAAFALAASAAGPASSAYTGGQSKSTTVVISDGGLPSSGLPALPGEVRYIPIGKSSENLAISALSVRAVSGGAELFARVTDYGASPHSALLSFYSGGTLITSEQVNLAPGESKPVILPDLPAGAAVYEARLSGIGSPNQPVDDFPLDNTAFAAYQPVVSGRALLVTSNPKGNLFLEQVLSALPGITPFRAAPAAESGGSQATPTGPAPTAPAVQIPKEAFDLYVLDGIYPPDLPPGNVLMVNPPANPLFQVGGVFTDTGSVQVAESPLTQYVDWSGVHVRKARQVDPSGWAQVLVSSQGGPLVLTGEKDGRRIAVVTFDLHDSDLPLQVAFPILFSNLVSYLSPSQAFQVPDGLQPGDSLSIRPRIEAGAPPNTIAVASPLGKIYSIQPGGADVIFDQTGELGLYAVNFIYPSGQPAAGQQAAGNQADYFAVNLFNPQESDIRPAQSIQVGRQSVAAAKPQELSQRELWYIPAIAALAVLLIEWWVYQRGMEKTIRVLKTLKV